MSDFNGHNLFFCVFVLVGQILCKASQAGIGQILFTNGVGLNRKLPNTLSVEEAETATV
jgi:hypothetical protein